MRVDSCCRSAGGKNARAATTKSSTTTRARKPPLCAECGSITAVGNTTHREMPKRANTARCGGTKGLDAPQCRSDFERYQLSGSQKNQLPHSRASGEERQRSRTSATPVANPTAPEERHRRKDVELHERAGGACGQPVHFFATEEPPPPRPARNDGIEESPGCDVYAFACAQD